MTVTRIVCYDSKAFKEKMEEIKTEGAKFHHSAWRKGYLSRKLFGIIEDYEGKFGTGYIVEIPSTRSTRYYRVSYYIKKGA